MLYKKPHTHKTPTQTTASLKRIIKIFDINSIAQALAPIGSSTPNFAAGLIAIYSLKRSTFFVRQ
jgi:hypothetical protein